MGLRFDVTTHGLDNIAARFANASERAKHAVAWQIRKDTSPFVPMLTGSLDQRTRVIGDTVIYPGPYARYLYYGKLMVDPDTGKAWAKRGVTKKLTNTDLVFNQAFHRDAQSHWFEASKAQNLDKWLRVAGRAIQSGL